MKTRKWLPVLVVAALLLGMMPAVAGAKASADAAGPNAGRPAAPAIANRLLREAGVSNRYKDGSDGGNFIRDVAHALKSGASFAGVPKDDVEEYAAAVASFLHDLGAEDRATAAQVALLSAVYSGAGSTFGSSEGDTLVLTFSGDIHLDGDQTISFAAAGPVGTAVSGWATSGPVLTITALTVLSTPGPQAGDLVVALAGVVDQLGHPVALPEPGVEIVGVAVSWTGTWDTLWDRHGGPGLVKAMVLAQDSEGNVAGTYSYLFAGETLYGTIEGSADGLILTGVFTDYWDADSPIVFTMSPDGGSFTGVWFEDGTGAGYWNGTRSPD